MFRPECCAMPNHRPLYSFKVPFAGTHIRVLFCYECRFQYEVIVPKPGESGYTDRDMKAQAAA